MISETSRAGRPAAGRGLAVSAAACRFEQVGKRKRKPERAGKPDLQQIAAPDPVAAWERGVIIDLRPHTFTQ